MDAERARQIFIPAADLSLSEVADPVSAAFVSLILPMRGGPVVDCDWQSTGFEL